MHINKLKWDSAFFGFPVGELKIIKRVDAEYLVRTLNKTEYKVTYLHSDDISIFEESITLFGYRDIRMTYKLHSIDAQRIPDSVHIYKGRLTDELLSLALMSGKYSRFKLDPLFAPWYQKLFKTWIEKSLSGEIADAVFVAYKDSSIAGFITLKKRGSVGHIGLIAVHPKYRGLGIASSLMRAAEAWYYNHGCKKAFVVTQSQNIQACGLYVRSGYSIFSKQVLLHYWSPQ